MSTIKSWFAKTKFLHKVFSNKTRPVPGFFLHSHSAWLTGYTDKNFSTSRNNMNLCPGFVVKKRFLHKECSTHYFLLSFFQARACKATVNSSFFNHALTRSHQKEHQRKCFIRQLSKNKKSLYWSKNVVNLHTVKTEFLQRTCLFRPNNRQLDPLLDPNKDKDFVVRTYVRTKHAKDIRFMNWANKKNESIFSFEMFAKANVKDKGTYVRTHKHDQLLFAKQSIQSNHLYQVNTNSKLVDRYGTNLDKMSLVSSDISNLALSLPTYTFLKQKGIHKIGSLIPYSSQALLQLFNKNKEMFAEVRRCLLLISTSVNA